MMVKGSCFFLSCLNNHIYKINKFHEDVLKLLFLTKEVR